MADLRKLGRTSRWSAEVVDARSGCDEQHQSSDKDVQLAGGSCSRNDPAHRGWGGAGRRGLGDSSQGGSRSSGIRVALQAFQVAAQLGGGLVAEIAIFLQGLVDDAFE